VNFEGFIGPSNETASRNISVERTINWYLEQTGAGTPKVPWALLPTPGLVPYVALAAGPVRALFAQDGRCFAVGGATFHELFASQTVVVRGTVALDANPATISSNGTGGNQLLVTSGGLVYVYDLTANTLTLEAGPPFPKPIVAGAFFQAYFLVLDTDGAFWFSTLEDGTTWDGLDFALESQFSDTVVAFTVTHDNVWLYGTQHIGPWYNTGGPTLPFTPMPGSIMQVGTAAPWSAANIFNTAIWVGQNSDGSGIVYLADGYQPKRISTHAVEDALRPVTASQLYAALGCTYQARGHTFYVLQVPGLLTTWVYDLLTQTWHERAVWDATEMVWRPWFGRNHQWFDGWHLVGDRQSRAVYQMRDDRSYDQIVLAL